MARTRKRTTPPVDLEQVLETDFATLDAEQRKKVATWLAYHGEDSQRLHALKFLESTEVQEDQVDNRTPKNREEAKERMRRLMVSAGRDLVDEAYEVAFAMASPGVAAAIPQFEAPATQVSAEPGPTTSLGPGSLIIEDEQDPGDYFPPLGDNRAKDEPQSAA